MRTWLMIFDFDNTVFDRGSRFGVKGQIWQELQDKAQFLGIKLELALVTNSCYESAAEYLEELELSSFAYLYFENGAIRLKDGQVLKEWTRPSQSLDTIRPLLEPLLQESKTELASVSWKHFTVACHLREPAALSGLLARLREILKSSDWTALASGPTTIELGPRLLDKSFALDRILATDASYEHIVFFGDKMFPGGNDYPLATDPRVQQAIEVTQPLDTERVLRQLVAGPIFDFTKALEHTNARQVLARSEKPDFKTLRRQLRYVFLDFDGTLTGELSQIYSPNIEVFQQLREEGYLIWIVTGRSLGWCDTLLQTLPVDGIIGENGAFALFWQEGRIQRWTSPCIDQTTQLRLAALKVKLMQQFPTLTWASDQDFRAYDLAIVTDEHGVHMPPREREAISRVVREAGASYSISSIHINIWFGQYNKARSLLDFMQEQFGLSYHTLQNNSLFIGDSPNDECLFRLLQHSFSVANIRDFIEQIQYRPRYISQSLAGQGSHEILSQLLEPNRNQKKELALDHERTALSLVIPCYQELEKLENSLRSYAAAAETLWQKRQEKLEVILVDNNSPQAAAIAKLVSQYQAHFDLCLIHQPRLASTFSLCRARNRGVANARSPLILFTDSDCMVEPFFAVELLEFVEQSPLSQHWIVTGERVFVETPRVLPNPSRELFAKLKACPSPSNYGLSKDRRFPWIESLPQVEHPWNFVHGCFMLVQKADYLAVGGSDVQYDGHWGYEEIDLAHSLVSKLGATIHYSPLSKVYHQEFPEDRLKIQANAQRTNKSLNPNWQRVCQKIEGFAEFKAKQFSSLGITVN